MKLKKNLKKDVLGIKISFEDGGKEVGRAFLYILTNQLHKRSFGFLEDVFVNEKYRGQGLGSKLITTALAEAKRQGCYKVIATSRNTKPGLKKYYAKFGLKVWGVEYRKDF